MTIRILLGQRSSIPWRVVQRVLFREIGMIIKDKFDGASEVTIEEEDAQPRIVMKNSQFKRHTNADL
ncbi:hypothetical protein ANCDUO_06626, partial [Ancylostoma duodenale]